jgi:hypothetical protein
VVSQARPAAGSGTGAVYFRYFGGRSLTAVGAATGHHYRFVGHGAILAVAEQDRRSLLAVPGLQELPRQQTEP